MAHSHGYVTRFENRRRCIGRHIALIVLQCVRIRMHKNRRHAQTLALQHVCAHTSRIACWKAQVPSKLTPLQNHCQSKSPSDSVKFSRHIVLAESIRPHRHIFLGLIICNFFVIWLLEVYMHLLLARSVMLYVTAFAERPVTITICNFRVKKRQGSKIDKNLSASRGQ